MSGDEPVIGFLRVVIPLINVQCSLRFPNLLNRNPQSSTGTPPLLEQMSLLFFAPFAQRQLGVLTTLKLSLSFRWRDFLKTVIVFEASK